MPLIYAFVSRGTTVLADYTSYTGNFSTVAIQCLEKCPTDNSKFTFTCDRHTFNYLVDGGFSECTTQCEELYAAGLSQDLTRLAVQPFW